MFKVSMSGVRSFDRVPDGNYQLRVEEVKSIEKFVKIKDKLGAEQETKCRVISCSLVVAAPEQFQGMIPSFRHNVKFFGDQFSWHNGWAHKFLKAIDQPYQSAADGTLEVEPKNWLGQIFYAVVVSRQDDKTGKVFQYLGDFEKATHATP